MSGELIKNNDNMREFTQEQKRAITENGQNILVSASAGSGKTSVLIERIIYLIENESDLSLSNLAVMTFTRAAASEMKDRLSDRVGKKILEGKNTARWQKILYELPMANITTIDSFCNSIVQNNFYKIRQNNIGLDVNYSVIDVIDLSILKNEILDEQLKTMETDRKTLLTDYFEDRFLFDRLKEVILKISDFCDSEPFCDEFLDRIYEMYSYNIGNDNRALKMYADIYHKDLEYLEHFENIKNFFIRDAGIDKLNDIARALIIEVKTFRKKLLLKKLEKGRISFSDLEHFALDILIDRSNNVSVPSDIAKSYQGLFKYILVDEYQDSNFVQEELINSISNGRNLFLVGDLKQSIYGFRQARCEFFSNRLNSYASGKNGTVIYLSKNFRSDGRILDFTNNICEQIMDGENYSIHYDERQRLVSGKNECNNDCGEPVISCLFVTKGYSYISDTDVSKHQYAARHICGKIKELYEKKGYKYSDIAILLRSLSGKIYDYIRAFEEYNIPYDIKTNTSFLSNTTVRTLVDYLRVIDNSIQDLPLCSAMLSNIGRFTAQELVKIRLAGLKDFNAAVKEYGSLKDSKYYDENLEKKIRKFFDKIDILRAYAGYLPLYKFVNLVVDELKIKEYAESFFDAEKRLEDLKQFLIFTLQYSNDNATLSGFLHYIERIEENDLSIERKGKVEENLDSVKLMTIHASKGLEFKAVFFANLTSRFNIRESSPALNSQLGLGLPLIDLKKRVKTRSMLLDLINAENKAEEMEEEIRLLYVALTRAKNRLVLVFDGELSGNFQKSICSIDKNILKAGSNTKTSLCDYILPIICKDNLSFLVDCLYLSDEKFFNKSKKSRAVIDISVDDHDKTVDYVFQKSDVEFILAAPIKDVILADRDIVKNKPFKNDLSDKVKNIIKKNREFIYKNKDLSKPLKLSVTEFAAIKKEKNVDYLTTEEIDLSIDRNKGVSVGTLYHKILEVLDFGRNYDTADDIEKFLKEIFVKGIIKKEDIKEIDIEKLLDFTTGSLYSRMKDADKNALLFREKKFLYELKAKDIFKDGAEQSVIIEGIIDAYFIEDNELVVIDYKSDRATDPDYYRTNYLHQLKLYSKALSEAYKMKIKNCIIYSLNAGSIVLE